MPLQSGTKLGPYEILEPIGAGGMGEVYRARDTKLGRDVAIKVLPEAFSQDKERLARFEREARLLASLNHPNIAAIYGLETSDAVEFLVMELVPGETLSGRIQRGPIPVDEALPLFRQIAEGLEAAHEKGIIHRDLKPANIKVTPEGKAKILDFGLAKAFAEEIPTSDLSQSPTITREGTQAGVILGTAAYMSPEQARGKTLDKRTDIWAFGCCFYESLAGHAAFLGETVPDTMAALLEREPDWQSLPAGTPAVVHLLLRTCLQKDPDRRIHDIADARIYLEGDVSELSIETARPGPPTRTRAWPWVVAGLMALAAALAILNSRSPATPSKARTTRATINLPETMALDRTRLALALSPDGSHLVFVSRAPGHRQLYLRPMDRRQASPIPGTEGAFIPFFSPDGEWVGFFVDGALKKVSIKGGGPPIEISSNVPPEPRGASWSADDRIVFAAFFSGILRVPADGGRLDVLASPARDRGEVQFGWPDVLPDGKGVIISVRTGGTWEDGHVELLLPETGERRLLIRSGYYGRYSPSGHLLFIRESSFMAIPFDLERLEVSGQAVSLGQEIGTDARQGSGDLSISAEGTLVYSPSSPPYQRFMQWVDRSGQSEALTDDPLRLLGLRISPDAKRIAVRILGANRDLWIYEIARGSLTRFTFNGNTAAMAWTPDGSRIAFGNDRAGPYNIYWKAVHGVGDAERLTKSEHPQFPTAWSPDGRFLLFSVFHPETGRDLGVLSLEDEPRERPFLATEFDESSAKFSPDGRWVAYESNESGRVEVYVVPFPNPDKRWQISTQGGSEPLWAPDGKELFYRNGTEVMRVAIRTEPDFHAEKPTLLFEGEFVSYFLSYDISPDGQRFLMLREEPRPGSTQIHVVLNWFEELERLVPTN